MKFRTAMLALAVGSLFSTAALAQGDDADIYASWDFVNSIWVYGDIYASGEIRVRSESGALVDQDQLTLGNLSLGDGDNGASASGDALRRASGNIGANIAAGVGNAQANDVALSSVDGNAVFASALVFNSQTTAVNGGTDAGRADNQLFYTASVTNNVLQGASGNIGLNVAAGVGNARPTPWPPRSTARATWPRRPPTASSRPCSTSCWPIATWTTPPRSAATRCRPRSATSA